MRLDQARGYQDRMPLRGAGTCIAVVNTGIRPTHEAFWPPASASRIILERNFTADHKGWADDAWDNHGHGTHVAGIAAGGLTADLPEGVAPEASIVAVKVLDGQGRGSLDTVAKALDWLSRDPLQVDVVNLSLGDAAAYEESRDALAMGRVYRKLANALHRLERRGTVVVAASGNGFYSLWRYGHCFPAILDTVIPAGAYYASAYGRQDHATGWVAFSSQEKQITPFSQRLPLSGRVGLTVFAPGARIVSAGNASDTATAEAQGTSQAAPVISGVCLLLAEEMRRRGLAVDPALIRAAISFVDASVNQLQHSRTATVSDPAEDDNTLGPLSLSDAFPRVDALLALQMLDALI